MTGLAGTAGRSKKSAHALEQDRPEVQKHRRVWFGGQLDLDPAKLVFIDETGLSTRMARLRGRPPYGERCRAGIPHGHWKTTTFTSALRLSGMTAPFVYDGAMNGNVCPRGDRGGRREPALPAALQSRLQSHRKRLRQA